MYETIYLIGYGEETINGEWVISGTFSSSFGYQYDVIMGRDINRSIALSKAVQSYLAIKAGQPIGNF